MVEILIAIIICIASLGIGGGVGGKIGYDIGMNVGKTNITIQNIEQRTEVNTETLVGTYTVILNRDGNFVLAINTNKLMIKNYATNTNYSLTNL